MKRKDPNRSGYFFIAPYFIVFALFGLFPIVYTLFLGFQHWDGISAMSGVGLANFERLLHDRVFVLSLYNTLRIWLTAFVPQMVIALLLSAMFTLGRLRAVQLFRSLFYLPNLITAVSVGLLFNLLLDGDASLANQVLLRLHLIHAPFSFFDSPSFTSLTVSFIQWWMWFGYTVVILTAGITALDTRLYEAARIDGASNAQVFLKIVVPLLRPTLVYLTVTSIIGGMQLFDVPLVLTNGQGSPEKSILTTSMYIYIQAFKDNNYGYGSAVSYALFLVIMGFAFLSRFLMRRREAGNA